MSDAVETPKKLPAVVLLGQQRHSTTLGEEVKGLEVEGQIAIITAGWQELESEDEELRSHLGGNVVNLKLHKRSEEVFDRDPDLRAAHRERQQVLRHKQDFYRIRLEHELDANHVIRQRRAPERVHEEEEEASIAAIRALDEYHLSQCARVHDEFEESVRPAERDCVRKHREEVAEILADSSAVAIAGGHVASLINRLRLFGVQDALDGHKVFAWAGGAMAITERIVLFHDSPPQGPGASELLDRGLGLVPGVVVFPQPEKRLKLDDPERVSVLARRFGPALCLALTAGARVTWRDDAFARRVGAVQLLADGTTAPFERRTR
jgi:hypothetical protein